MTENNKELNAAPAEENEKVAEDVVMPEATLKAEGESEASKPKKKAAPKKKKESEAAAEKKEKKAPAEKKKSRKKEEVKATEENVPAEPIAEKADATELTSQEPEAAEKKESEAPAEEPEKEKKTTQQKKKKPAQKKASSKKQKKAPEKQDAVKEETAEAALPKKKAAAEQADPVRTTKKATTVRESLRPSGKFEKAEENATGRGGYRPNVTVFRASEKVTLDGASKRKKEGPLDNEAVTELYKSLDQNQQKVLTGKADGYRYYKENNSVVAFVDFMGYNVIIRSDSFILPKYDEATGEYVPYNTDNYSVEEITKYLQRRMFSDVDFIVNAIKPGEDGKLYVLASRLAGMAKMRQRFWNAKEDSGVKGEKQKVEDMKDMIRVGKTVEARVVTVVKNSIIVEAYGCETRIFVTDLSYIFMRDARNHFKNGDKIDIIPTSITKKKTKHGTHFEFTASHKATKYLEYRASFMQYRKFDKITGVVSHIKFNEKKNEFEIYVNRKDQIQIVCIVKKGVDILPMIDDYVHVRITNMDYDKLYAWGEIVHKY